MLTPLLIIVMCAAAYALLGGVRFWLKTERNHRRVIEDMLSAGGNTPDTRMQIARLSGERHGFLIATLLYGARSGAIAGVLVAMGYLAIRGFVH